LLVFPLFLSEDLLFMLNGMGIENGVDFEKAMAIGQHVQTLVKGIKTDSYQLRLRECGEELTR
jgi:hydroxymethylglutaryl-CoA lyase